jgi:hypothetical protein
VHRDPFRRSQDPAGDVYNLGAERAAAIHTRDGCDRSFSLRGSPNIEESAPAASFLQGCLLSIALGLLRHVVDLRAAL